uniref:Uncharacterized protein n=1 Tax=Nosema pernyi TaxID=1112939 RepID=X5E4K2_9MICR|nr:hypothetical protein NP_c37 [Nosema pernyi]
MTFVRRFYLNAYRTERFFLGLAFQMLVLLLLVGCLYLAVRIIVGKSLSDVMPGTRSFKILVDYGKSYFTSDMKRFLSHFLFTIFFIVATLYVFYLKNVCDNRIQILEDIYSAKYSVLTCFLGYMLHDFFVTTFWFTFTYGVVLFSGLLSLINYWYPIYIFLAICCFTINYIFMKYLFGFSNKSKILSSIMLGTGIFAGDPKFFNNMINFISRSAPGHENKIKYVGSIFIIFPQMLLVGLINYKNIQSIQDHKGDLKNNQLYVPDVCYENLKNEEPSFQFRFLGLDDAPYGVVVSIFIVSLLVNFFGALYLFNRHVNAELRLKMK